MWNRLFAFSHHSSVGHIAILVSPVLVSVAIFILFETAILPIFTSRVSHNQTVETASDLPDQIKCIDRVFSRLKLEAVDLLVYEDVWRLCGTESFNALSLQDFRIRREKFVRQELDERVTLALVVGITISGVLMAGLQLLMSYKLAQAGHSELAKDIELSVQKDKIALKSSVVGLAILVISLAFFVVYVKWIYTINEVSVDAPKSQTPGRQIPVDGAIRPRQRDMQQPTTSAPPGSQSPNLGPQ